MKIICSGYPKTGTKTLACALGALGYNVYDFIENFWYLDKEWNEIFNRGGNVDHFRRMFENVDVVCDLPACFFWEELHEAFPDAKIILAYRESGDEDDWWKSMRNQVMKVDNFLFRLILAATPTGHRMLQFMRNIGRVVFGQLPMSRWGPVTYNETLMRKSYRRHYNHVIQNAPREQLLIYKASQGWEPLCEFLGHPVPSAPYPHKNVRGEVIETALQSHPFMREMKFELAVVASLFVVVIGSVTTWAAYKCWQWW